MAGWNVVKHSSILVFSTIVVTILGGIFFERVFQHHCGGWGFWGKGETKDVDPSLIAVPLLLWWTPFSARPEQFITCDPRDYVNVQKNEVEDQKISCFVTENRSMISHPALQMILFYGTAFSPLHLPLPRSPQHQWALLHEESPRNQLVLMSNAKVGDFFNVTATFGRSSDFPLTLQHLYSLEELKSLQFYVSAKEKFAKTSEELSPVLFLSSDCSSGTDREEYVSELMKYIPVDSYGQCLHNEDLPPGLESPVSGFMDQRLLHFVAKYKFHIAIENWACDDYITEKLWRPLIVGSVPIYFGSPSVVDWTPNGNSSIILTTDFKSPKELATFLKNMKRDEYEKYLSHKRGEISNARLEKEMLFRRSIFDDDSNFVTPALECFLCSRIHFQTTSKRTRHICPAPLSALTGLKNPNNFWTEFYHSAVKEGFVLAHYLEHNKNFSSEEYSHAVIEYLTAAGGGESD